MDSASLFRVRRHVQKQKMRKFLQQIKIHRLSTSTGELHHEHPLILNDQPNDGGGEEVPCDGCILPLSGAVYICKQCKIFLHKSCAELPETIIHFLHPKHPLTFFAISPYKNSPNCDSCVGTIWGFSYHCSICRFDLDIKCVLLQQILEHEGHEHLFKLHRPTPFTCDACGKISNDISCICSTCHLWVHKSCASLPPTIKHVGHDHPLSLTHSIGLNDPMDILCDACGKDVDRCYWCYRCWGCRSTAPYFAHFDCVASETKLGDEHNELEDGHNELGSASASVPSECTIDLISNDVNEISLTKMDNDHVNEISLTKIERVTELQHFSHQHSLTLNNDEPEREEISDGCVQTISGPFYNCAQCNFFLHVSCAELPDKIQHLLHPHPLTLISIRTLDSGLFYCSAYFHFFNGFAYACKNCHFYIDLKCTSVSGTLTHKAHEHTLSLNQKESKSVCNACGVRCRTKFRCEACDFNLDLRCAVLPSSATHEWDKHPLKLTFSISEDKLDTYYCDFCEERKDDPNHWFYYYEDCDIAVHPQCLLGKHMMVKFGKSFKSDNCPHRLTLVKNTRLPHRSDHYCDHEKDNTILLECADCDVHDHFVV